MKRVRSHGGLTGFFLFALIAGILMNPLAAKAAEVPIDDILQYIEDLQNWAMSDFAAQNRESLAKAVPDECFYGIGDENNLFVPGGIDTAACLGDNGTPKVNQAYVWGLAKSGNNVWFGTAPNVHCLVIGGYLGVNSSIKTDSYVCELGDGGPLSDWRPPRLYLYNTSTKELVDKTPADPRINTTLGIRSAGTLNGVAFLAGPGFRGVNIFAFNAATGQYLGSYALPGANNIRKWIVANGVLYTAIGAGNGGQVLRWTGNINDPFHFQVVGQLDGSGAELAVHEGRLFVSTWPGSGEITPGAAVAGLFMSPLIPQGGLTAAHAESWTKVWEVTDYEPDPVTAMTYGGGALASFDGYLYWGTMHVPMLSTLAHFTAYSGEEGMDQQALLKALLGTYRAISIFRAKNFSENGNVELVYGMPVLPAYLPSDVRTEIPVMQWKMVPNKMGGAMPLYGPSGFGNPFNNYTWTMAVYGGQLYVGTMDWSYLMFGDADISLPETMPLNCDDFPGIDCDLLTQAYEQFAAVFDPTRFYGADLFRFSSSDCMAIPESLAGVGNYTSYGIRTMVADDALYLGMANPMNLLTDTSDDIPEGGWELLKLSSLRGDLNSDGVVNMTDIQILLSHQGETSCVYPAGDLNDDDVIDILDTRMLITENPALARDRRLRTLLR